MNVVHNANCIDALREYPDSLEPYDTVYLATPTTGAPCPCASLPFWNGSTSPARPSSLLHPRGSGLGHSEADIRRLCHGAKVGKGLAIHGTAVCREERALEAWIKGGN